MAVNTAVRQQTHQMQGRVMLFAVGNCFLQFRNGGKTAFFHSLGDTGQFLIHDAACADVGVTNFRVAHLTSWQANIHAGSLDLGVRIACHQFINVWGICGIDGIAHNAVVDAEAIQNH